METRAPMQTVDENDSGEALFPYSATLERRRYNRWVADETMEDFALRFTARRARRWSYARVANTALGSISFLALEAIGGAITLTYGFTPAVLAIMLVGVILFLTGLPISYYGARYGVDIDLLTRGGGFGYIGSTITSLIYASFTFIFFALEASILAFALEFCFGVPLSLGYLVSALVIIPLVMNGISKISAFQAWTQPFWIALHLAPFVALALTGVDLEAWTKPRSVLGARPRRFRQCNGGDGRRGLGRGAVAHRPDRRTGRHPAVPARTAKRPGASPVVGSRCSPPVRAGHCWASPRCWPDRSW